MNSKTLIILVVLAFLAFMMLQGGGCPGVDPVDPDAPRTLLAVYDPGVLTIDQVDEHWKIRSAIRHAARTNPDLPHYLWLPKNAKDQRLQQHGAVAAYVGLNKPLPYVWDIAATQDGGRIVNEGALNAETVLGWAGLAPRAPPETAQAPNIEPYLDVDFEGEPVERLGRLEPSPTLRGFRNARMRNIRELAGFNPIPRSEWDKWCERFPPERLVDPISHTTEQVMGSCVGHSCMNSVEGPAMLMFGERLFRPLSAISMYTRIGRSPGSGAYVGDAADEIYERGILPAAGSVDINGVPYAHTHHVSGDFYDDLPSGWESTANMWRAFEVFRVDDDEAGFAVLMRDGLRVHMGRSGHALSLFGVVKNGSRYVWAYENSWGTDWGDYNKSIGYDSRFTSGYVYIPVVRDEIVIPTKDSRLKAPDPELN